MNEKEQNADVKFSKQSQLLISRYGVIDQADKRFWRDWCDILEATAAELENDGYLTSLGVDEQNQNGILQVAKPDWPKPFQNSIHFEVWLDRSWAVKRKALLMLDIEGATPDQDAVIDSLRRILLPYENAGLLLKVTGCKVRPYRSWRFFEETLSLPEVSSKKLIHVLRQLATVSSAIDEARFIKNGQPVWRTALLKDDPKPYIKWHDELGTGEEGGWKFSRSGGRLGSPSLKCNPNKSNYHEGKNILRLKANRPFYDLSNGQRVYYCAVVHSAQGGQVQFYAEARKEGKFQTAFSATGELQAVDGWQLVGWQGRVSNPEDYDFAKQGLNAFLIIKAPESGLRIDSIELGVRDD